MDVFKQECKLCDNIVSDGNFEVIEGVAKSIFDTLLLKLTLDDDTKNVICTMCSSKLFAALNFKSICLYTDNIIIPYIDFENQKLVDLKEIYAKEEENKQGSIMLEDREICRLCLKPMNSDYKSIQEVPIDSIQIYIPEINFAVTTNPAICLKCHDAVRVHSSFIRSCLEKKEKRNTNTKHVGDMLLANPCIKVEEIEIKLEETDERISEGLCNLNKEENEEGVASLVLPDGLLDKEETKSLYDLDELLKQTSAQSTQCEKSVYKTTGDYNNRKSKCQYISKSRPKFRTKCLPVEKYQCDYKCNQNVNRHTHQLRHKDPSEVRMFKCNECDYKSIRKSNLKQHQLKHKDPSEVQVFECDKCDFKNIYKGNLVKHQLVHIDPSEVQMFKCDQCDFKSIHKVSLRVHQWIHKDPSEMQMFKCDECDYKSIRKDTLKQHQLTHKDPSEAQMFKCDHCDYKSIHKRSLRIHLLVHKDPSEVQMFKCDECDYRSMRRSDFKKHQLRHKDPSEVQMFKCDDCDYKSIRKGDLHAHQLKHKPSSQVQRYRCDECDYKCIRKQNVINHQKRHKCPPV